MELYLADIQRDDSSESYSASYANLSVFNTVTLSASQFIGANKKPLTIPAIVKLDINAKTSLLPLLESFEIPEEEEDRVEEINEEDEQAEEEEEATSRSNYLVASPVSAPLNVDAAAEDMFEELSSPAKNSSTLNGDQRLPPLPSQTPPPPPQSWASSDALSPVNGDNFRHTLTPTPSHSSPLHLVVPANHHIPDEAELAMTV